MSGLLKKEIRLLLPSWAIALALALLAWLLVGDLASASRFRVSVLVILVACLFPAMVVMMALDSFGRELSAGTFSNLLAQPVSRARIWWTKTLLLAAAIGSACAIWFVVLAEPGLGLNPQELHSALVAPALFPLVIFSGALWTMLLLRQVAAAFWLTVLIPVMLAMFTMYFAQKLGGEAQMDGWIIAVLVLYSIAGFWGASRMFLRAQDVHWTGGEIALPGWFKWPRWLSSTRVMPGRHPRLALLRKEFQLHQSQLVIAGVLAVVHLAVIVLRPAQGNLNAAPLRELLTYHLWVLWPVMALLIGCAAVAEERKLGTLEAQLCLPVRRRMQFVLKAGVALGLSLFFGVVMPVLFEGSRILPEFEVPPVVIPELRGSLIRANAGSGVVASIWEIVEALSPLAPFLPFLIVSAILLAVSFYASTLARNTLQAIAPAILGIVMIWVLVFGAETISGSHNPPWRGPLIYLIGVPVLTLTLAGLAYWNFKRVLVGWPVWRRNLIIFLAALVGVMAVTTSVYRRAWELAMRLEPARGSERLSRTEPPAIEITGSRLAAQFPDGRLWQSIWLYDVAPDEGGSSSLINPQVLGGSNWTHAAYSILRTETVAIQTDGSLWLLETPHTALAWTNNQLVTGRPEPTRFTRIGDDTNWHQVIRAAWSPSFLLLKTDGSLWLWGTNRFDSQQKWPGLTAFELRRLGEASDWAEMRRVNTSTYLWKTNGQAWAENPFTRGPKQTPVELAPGFKIARYPEFDRLKWRSLAMGQPFQVGVRDDGTLWGWGIGARVFSDRNVSSGQIGDETNWLAVACADTTMVALKTDGSLWKWDFSYRSRPDRRAVKADRLSVHRDWLAITGDWDGMVSLAADGSLWHWSFRPAGFSFAGFRIPPLLAASRRPHLVGNVLETVP